MISILLISCPTIQYRVESANNLEVEKHKEVLEEFQGTVVHRYRLEKAKLEYNRIKEDLDRSRLIVATLKQQVRKPPHHITEVSLAYLQRDLKKYQYHTNLLERRRARRYTVYREEKPPIEVESDSEYSDGGYSTAEDLKDKEYLPHRYKLRRNANRVPHSNQPRPQSDSDIEVDPINPPPVNPSLREPNSPVPDYRAVDMDQQRIEAAAREMIRRGEFNHLFDPNNLDEKRGQGNGNRDRQNRQDDRNERSLRYSIRDIPTFDGNGDAMPHTHLIEFEDFLVNTGFEINELPQHDEPQAVDRPHYEAVIRDVVSKFKASLKGKPRLWFEMQYPNVDDEPNTVQAHKNMLSTFRTEHNPIGSTREQQIMAWKTLKWEPTKEKLDEFVYKFRRVAKELGHNADENLDVFSCCVPSHLYLYLKGATTIKEAMENIKRACVLGGVSVQATPAPAETKTTPAVPFMSMNDRQTLKTVSFKEEGSQDKMNDGLEKLSQILDKQIQLAEKQNNDNKSRGRRRERRDSRDRRSRSYDRSSLYDRSSSCDRSKSRERSNSSNRSGERSSRNKSRNQNSREKRNNSGTRYSSGLFCDHCKMTNHEILNCYKLQKTLKKKGVSLNEATRKNMSEQEKYQVFMEFKTYMDARDPTN